MLIPRWLQHDPTINAAHQWCVNKNVRVIEEYCFKTPGVNGFYHAQTRTIYLSRNLKTYWLLPVLAHETFHAANEHHGHQPAHVEQHINQLVAASLIDREEYMYWEGEYAAHIGGIAAAMQQPRWLIEAYRRQLKHTAQLTTPIH